jgi:gluconate kinase
VIAATFGSFTSRVVELIAGRLATRKDHFMPPACSRASCNLSRPDDENPIAISVDQPIELIVGASSAFSSHRRIAQ